MSRRLSLMLLVCSLVVSFITAAQADPAWYVKKVTWRETVNSSLDNKARGITAVKARPTVKPTKGFKPFVTKVLKGGQDPLKISVPIAGEQDLILVATVGGDGDGCDHSVWANAKLIDAAGKVTWLDTIKPKRFQVGWGNLDIKANNTRSPVIIGKQKFSRYIFAHAFSTIHYEINRKYVRFEASVGVDQRAHRSSGSVSFIVTTDRKSIPKGGNSAAMSMIADPIWTALLRDFPASRQEIMTVYDWLRQDDLGIEDASDRFKAPAAAALKLATDTLAYVTKSGPQTKLAAELASLSRKHTAAKDSQWRDLYMETKKLRRRIILAHPALDFEKILINRNPPTKYSHNSDQHLGRHSRVGKGLTILTDWKSGNLKATPMLKDKLPEGAVRNPDLHYDAEKIAFAFCDHSREGQKRYFLYEAAIDGSWVRQLTGTKRDKFNTWDNRATVIIEDNDPCYMPDDEIIFVTTRCQSFGRCHGGRYNPAWNLHRCDKNGDNIKQLSFGNENEYEPAVLNDGRIIFTRWEYTNRHEMLFHMLWVCRPDGTNVAHFFGNDMLHPMMMVEATAMPGTHRVVTTAQGHHSYNTGTTVILDTNKGENTEKAITHLTPETPYSESPGGGWHKTRGGYHLLAESAAREREAEFAITEHLTWLASTLTAKPRIDAILTIVHKLQSEQPLPGTGPNPAVGADSKPTGIAKPPVKVPEPKSLPEEPFKPMPGVIHVEAETFSKMSGVKVYDCFTGGKQVNFQKNIQSSSIDYAINAPKAGVYGLTIRHAVGNREQILNVQIGDQKPTTIKIPNTNGLWKTSPSVDVKLTKGSQKLKISTPYQRGVAIRWFELESK